MVWRRLARQIDRLERTIKAKYGPSVERTKYRTFDRPKTKYTGEDFGEGTGKYRTSPFAEASIKKGEKEEKLFEFLKLEPDKAFAKIKEIVDWDKVNKEFDEVDEIELLEDILSAIFDYVEESQEGKEKPEETEKIEKELEETEETEETEEELEIKPEKKEEETPIIQPETEKLEAIKKLKNAVQKIKQAQHPIQQKKKTNTEEPVKGWVEDENARSKGEPTTITGEPPKPGPKEGPVVSWDPKEVKSSLIDEILALQLEMGLISSEEEKKVNASLLNAMEIDELKLVRDYIRNSLSTKKNASVKIGSKEINLTDLFMEDLPRID